MSLGVGKSRTRISVRNKGTFWYNLMYFGIDVTIPLIARHSLERVGQVFFPLLIFLEIAGPLQQTETLRKVCLLLQSVAFHRQTGGFLCDINPK